MKSPGFMLLELLVSMLISSLLAVALFAAFGQTNRAVHTVDDMVDVSYKQTAAIQQLTKDISGAFIPVQGRKKKSAEPKKEAQEKIAASQNKKEPQKKRLTKFFYGTAKDGQLNVLTCITNNSTLEYPVGIVRVVYRLVPEVPFNSKKPAYVLQRQESATKLEFDDFRPEQKEGGVRAYELIGNVKKITVAYTAQVNKPQTQPSSAAKASANAQSVEREYKVLNEWVMEEEQEKQYKDYTKIPYAVDIDLVLWDERKEREKKVSFKIMVPNEVVEYEPEEAPKAATTPPQPKPPTQQQPGKPQVGGKQTTATAGRQRQQVPGPANGKGTALDQTLSALKTMLMADGALPQKGAA